MSISKLAERAADHLHFLCVHLPTRAVGSQGNRDATTYAAGVCRQAGWEVETPTFQCMAWDETGADLCAGSASFEILPSPYSLPAQVSAPLVVLSSIESLEATSLTGKIVLLRGDLAREQLAPKHFPWWNPEEHQRIIAALEKATPLAILAATTRNPETAGAVYPFPLIEDGDFDIPSAYMTEDEGQKLAVYAGRKLDLEIRARRTFSEGCNVLARKGGAGLDAGARATGSGRTIVTAHIDAKRGTPGALDDGTGIAVLLLLAELLRNYEGNKIIELATLNGEDYYAAAGERLYVEQNADMSTIALVINIDGAAYREGDTHFSLYECPEDLVARARSVLGEHGLVEGPQWYQGDHSIVVMAGRPAAAITSARLGELMAEITHTSRDIPEIVDPMKVAQIAIALQALLT